MRYKIQDRRQFKKLQKLGAAALTVCVAGLLQGCRERPAPAPTVETTVMPTVQTSQGVSAQEEAYALALAKWWRMADYQYPYEERNSPAARLNRDSYGYAFLDLDGDGGDELLITDGTRIHAIYTGGEDFPFLMDSTDRSVFLHQDGTIGMQTVVGGFVERFQVFRFDNFSLETVEDIVRTGSQDNPYERQTLDGSGTAVTAEEFLAVLDSYRLRTIPYKPLSQWEGYADVLAGKYQKGHLVFEDVLDDYRRAIREGWTAQQCDEAQISLLTTFVESEEQIGFCLQDLDGDRIEELIVTDGNVLYGVYCRVNGKVETILCSWERNAYFLCADGLIASQGSGGAAVSYYEFWEYDDIWLTSVERLSEDYDLDMEKPWYRLDAADQLPPEAISQEEFQSILDAHPHIRLEFTPLSQLPQ